MKVIGHYPEEGDVREDPNLRSLLEHSDKLLSEEYLFESPFKDVIRSTSDVNPNDLNLNVDDIGLEDDFDLSDSLSDFVSKIRKEDTVETTVKWIDRVAMILLIIVVLIPFCTICYMWCDGRKYQDKTQSHVVTQQKDSSCVLTKSSTANFNMVSAGSQNNVQIDFGGVMPYDQNAFSQKENQDKDQCGNIVEKIKEHSYDWLIILFGIIFSLAIVAVIIVLAINIRKKDEWEHEDKRLFFEHQNKMINEYANHLYSLKRVKLQQSEFLLSLKQQYALQQLDFQQKNMDMLKKEQDMAWKYKEEKMNAIKEYLSNWEYEMKQETKREIIKKNNNSKK